MERSKQQIKRKKLVPKVPIKTYKWEDVRRSRKKGGYPWTHLYKEAFTHNMDSHKTKASSPSDSLDIKEITEDDVKGLEDIDSSYVVIEGPILVEELKEESADSSDNISMYLDKEEPIPIPSNPTQFERAKSEEPRKRKLSIESNYSLSKQRIMKRLKDAKEKLFSPFKKQTSTATKPPPSSVQVKKSKVVVPESATQALPPPPVYIHVPLKPPEGQTDEFSYLEFEEKRAPPPTLQIDNVVEDTVENFPESSTLQNELNTLSPPNLMAEDQEDDVSAVIFLDGDNPENADYDIMVVDIDEKGNEVTMSQVTNTEIRRQFLESIKRVESQGDLNETATSNKTSLSRSSSRGSEKKQQTTKRRAKSAEPEKKKRKSSIESSHSTKSSTSFLKKLKEFKPFRSKTSIVKAEVPSVPSTPTPVKENPTKPVYIHIPLKPPPGETDEFSHLEFEARETKGQDSTTPTPSLETEEKEEISTVAPPQMILLTPPSTDETLESVETSPLPGEEEIIEPKVPEEKVTIDEEDGLLSKQDVGKKSNIKNETSPLMLKKKVSFKRRKSQNKDEKTEEKITTSGSYEDIQGNDEVKEETVMLKAAESAEVPEASDNKWSTVSDHDYETINPPATPAPEITVSPEEHEMKRRSASREIETKQPSNPPTQQHPSASKKFQNTLKENATKFKNKLKSIKKPNIALPPRPKLPEMLNFRKRFDEKKETESLSEKTTTTSGVKIFDFSTYPRRLKKRKSAEKITVQPQREPRWNFGRLANNNNSGPETIRIPLHSENSMDQQENHEEIQSVIQEKHPKFEHEKRKENKTKREKREELELKKSKEIEENLEKREETFPELYQGNGVEINQQDHQEKREEFHPEPKREKRKEIKKKREKRKEQNQNITPEFYQENNVEIHPEFIQERVETHPENYQGNYENYEQHMEIVTDLDQPDVIQPPAAPIRTKGKFQQNDSLDSKKLGSSQSSLSVHRRGVLEEIDSDQFFLREKGISQDNIDMGHYLSTEIREAFRSPPSNALSDMYSYEEFRSSNQSLPETTKRQKPRRKKTPKLSYEKLRYESEENIDYNYMPPIPPKRRSKTRRNETLQRRASEPSSEVPPPRKNRSLNASESIIFDEVPVPPRRSRSKTDSFSFNVEPTPVVEEPCVKDLRDAMGYAIVDKNAAKNWEHKFCTVPRTTKPPERPQRNYTTLTPSRPPRRKNNMTDEEKENIDITQYIEIDQENVEKIQARPLPPPPRPPRNKTPNQEINVETQTEPLPSDFEVEQVIHEETDKIMTPTAHRKILTTPTHYTYEEETITHGQLLVEPNYNPERVIPIERTNTFEKIHVNDLDVDRLNVNELVASKIIVSEIESGATVESSVVRKIIEQIQKEARKKTDEQQQQQQQQVDNEAPPRPPLPQYTGTFFRTKASSISELTSSNDEQPKRQFKRKLKQCKSEPSIPQLTGRLVTACSTVARNSIKRLIQNIYDNITNSPCCMDFDNQRVAELENQQHPNVQLVIVMLLVLIAGLLLLGYGDGRTVHLHHWEYFNPPRDI